MKRGRKAERGIQWERGKNEKEIKRKGDREKRDKEKETGEEKRERKRKRKFHCSHLVQEKASRKKSPWPRGGPGPAPKSLQHPI